MENTNRTDSTHAVPNKAFDMEYSTQFKREYMYLKDHGIRPTIIKRTKDYGIPTYKYSKTPELFIALTAFYSEIKSEKMFTRYSGIAEKSGEKVATKEEAWKVLRNHGLDDSVIHTIDVVE